MRLSANWLVRNMALWVIEVRAQHAAADPDRLLVLRRAADPAVGAPEHAAARRPLPQRARPLPALAGDAAGLWAGCLAAWRRRPSWRCRCSGSPHVRGHQIGAKALALPVVAVGAPGRDRPGYRPAALQGFNFKGGVVLPPELVALWLGLSIYASAFIAEIVRGSIQAVPKGQREAARSLGLKPGPELFLVVLPQALRMMVPPLTSQYLNIIKASTLGAAVAYPEIVQIFAGTVLNQSGRRSRSSSSSWASSWDQPRRLGAHELVQPQASCSWSDEPGAGWPPVWLRRNLFAGVWSTPARRVAMLALSGLRRCRRSSAGARRRRPLGPEPRRLPRERRLLGVHHARASRSSSTALPGPGTLAADAGLRPVPRLRRPRASASGSRRARAGLLLLADRVPARWPASCSGAACSACPLSTPSQWGGLMVNCVLAFVAVAGSLPLGIMLALGRRSRAAGGAELLRRLHRAVARRAAADRDLHGGRDAAAVPAGGRQPRPADPGHGGADPVHRRLHGRGGARRPPGRLARAGGGRLLARPRLLAGAEPGRAAAGAARRRCPPSSTR